MKDYQRARSIVALASRLDSDRNGGAWERSEWLRKDERGSFEAEALHWLDNLNHEAIKANNIPDSEVNEAISNRLILLATDAWVRQMKAR